jgi:FkbM family methyltransferase
LIKNTIKAIVKFRLFNPLFLLLYKVCKIIIPVKNLAFFHRLPVYKNVKVSEEGFNSFYMISNGSDSIAKELYWTGLHSYETRTLSIITSLMKQSSVFFDIGANTGLFSLLAASSDRMKQVNSFEPMDAAYDLFKDNISLNNFSKIKINKIALSDFDGESIFNIQMEGSDIPLGSSLRSDVGEHEILQKIKVKTMKLDTYANDLNITQIDLMKIDTEGTEDKVLEGAVNSIDKFRPVMICEILAHTGTEPGIHKILDNRNYNYYFINDNELEQVDFLKGDPYIVSNYLLMPSEKADLLLKDFKIEKITEKIF